MKPIYCLKIKIAARLHQNHIVAIDAKVEDNVRATAESTIVHN